MKLKGKFSILACLIFCLLCLLNDNADDSLYSYNQELTAEDIARIESQTDHQVKTEDFSFSVPETQCRVPRQSNVINSFRTYSQAKRQNLTNLTKIGFTLSKSGKSMNPYTTSLFFISINKFPSGLAESGHHLINLGKLII